MITDLPYTLTVDGIERALNCDFRDIILICNAFNDSDLNQTEKLHVMLSLLYEEDYETFTDITEAV